MRILLVILALILAALACGAPICDTDPAACVTPQLTHASAVTQPIGAEVADIPSPTPTPTPFVAEKESP